MSLILNILWIIFGGFFVFLGYVSGGIALCLTIIGIPWGIQCFKLAILGLFPFGSQTVAVDNNMGGDSLNLVLNIVWLIFGGIFVFFSHMFWGVLLCLSIIGIPFGLQHFKMMRLAFTPFGRRLVDDPY
jgi:uncharacterized membrane protein YccF (DUF307 family)